MKTFARTELLLGKENMDILKNAHVLVVGVGGVGGYACEMLARSGIGKLTLVDMDKVSESNLNRQIIALHSTLNKPKVEVMKAHINDINPDCIVIAKNVQFNQNSVDDILGSNNYNYVIDAIDLLEDKTLLVYESQKRNLNIISALGAGNRTGIPTFKVADIYQTYNDGLAKKFRKVLRDKNVEKLTVVFSEEKSVSIQNSFENGTRHIGSIAYSPAMCGCVLSAYVINQIISK